MGRLSGVIAITVVHLLLTVVLFGVAAGMSLSRLDSGGAPSLLEQAASLVTDVLLLPVARPVIEFAPASWNPGLWGYLILVLNSAIWGMVGSLLLSRLRSQSRRDPLPT